MQPQTLPGLPADRGGPDTSTPHGHRRSEGGFDLIVMGTHGRTGLSDVVMGSVAERVVRPAPCPVLTVHAGEAAGASAPFAAA